MTPRKPKPRKPAPRKAAKPTLEQRVAYLEETVDVIVAPRVDACQREMRERLFCLDADFEKNTLSILRRLDALETRSRYRDASHDEPVSNASEAIGHFTLTEPHRPWWRRFLGFMGAP